MKTFVVVFLITTAFFWSLVLVVHQNFKFAPDESAKVLPVESDQAAASASNADTKLRVSGVTGSTNETQAKTMIDIPFERALLTGNSLDVVKIENLLKSEKFDAHLGLFEGQSASDADAAALSATYRRLLGQQIVANEIKADLGRMVCGVTTCVGVLRNGSEAEYDRWANVFFKDLKIKGYGLTGMTATGVNGKPEHRFVFSTDPTTNSVTAPLR